LLDTLSAVAPCAEVLLNEGGSHMNCIKILPTTCTHRIMILLFIGLVGISNFGFAATPDPISNPENTYSVAPLVNQNDASTRKYIAPSTKFDLSGWKLQIPGPKDITSINGYASKYFYLNSSNQICFWVDSTEKGHTANSEYVRSELRHLSNWSINSAQTMSATLKVNSAAVPDKVTVLQIHGITSTGDNAPPLLRIALNSGTLYAFIKTDNSGNNTDSIVLASGIGDQEFSCTIKVENQRLIIIVNGAEKLKRSLSFWKYANYFKAGCYPQSHNGTITVTFGSLSVK
jgi:hypothetical protein